MEEMLIWRETWELGIEAIDADHREVAGLVNRLIAGTRVPDHPDCQDALAELIGGLKRHFEVEERFLERIDYPHLYDHQREHTIQMAEFVDMQRDLAHRHARCLDRETVQGIKAWFFNHIIAEDRQYAEFYRRKYGSPPVAGAPVP
jgi:hemerythrin